MYAEEGIDAEKVSYCLLSMNCLFDLGSDEAV